ncbi:odorant-binding protein 73a [Cochliomyia hominivorax]
MGTNKKTKCLNPPRTARRVQNFIKECQEEVKNKLVLEAFNILKQEIHKTHPPIEPNDDSVDFIGTIETPINPTPNTPTTTTHTETWKETIEEVEHIIGPDHNGEVLVTDGEHYEYIIEENPVNSQRRMIRLLRRISRVGDISNGIYHPTLVPSEDKRIAGCLLHCVYAKNNAIDKLGWPTLDGLVDFYSGGVNEHGFFMATLRSVNLCLRAVTKKYQVDRRKLPEKGESCDLAFDVFDCISDQITGYCLDQYKS